MYLKYRQLLKIVKFINYTLIKLKNSIKMSMLIKLMAFGRNLIFLCFTTYIYNLDVFIWIHQCIFLNSQKFSLAYSVFLQSQRIGISTNMSMTWLNNITSEDNHYIHSYHWQKCHYIVQLCTQLIFKKKRVVNSKASLTLKIMLNF